MNGLRNLLIAGLAATAVLSLSGCAAAEPDIEAQRDEMKPLVQDLADLIYIDGVPAAEIFDSTSLCNALEGESKRTREQYSEFWQSAFGDVLEQAPSISNVEAVFAEHDIEPVVTIDAREPESYETETIEYTYEHSYDDGGSVRLRFWLGDGIARFQLSASTDCATRD